MAFDTEILIVIALMVFVVGRRLIRQNRGMKYSIASIFMIPVIYIALTLYFIIGLPLLDDAAIALAIIVGIVAGRILGKRSELFEKDGKILYRRSREVMAIWIVGFLIRIVVDFFYDPYLTGIFNGTSPTVSLAQVLAYESSPIVFGADILLAFSAGLLLGEALVLYMNHLSRYRSKGTQ